MTFQHSFLLTHLDCCDCKAMHITLVDKKSEEIMKPLVLKREDFEYFRFNAPNGMPEMPLDSCPEMRMRFVEEIEEERMREIEES